jgi:hypothetical protein
MPAPDQPTPETPEPAAPAAPPAAPNADAPLGDAGKAALDSERKARKDAEKAARDAQARLKALEDAQLSDTEKLKKEAEDGRQLAEKATGKLRNANLRDALAAKGFSGPQAKAVAKLLDSVDYDSDDEPTNLDARLEAAAEDYGALVVPNGHQPVPTFDGGARVPTPAAKSPEQEHQDLVSALIAGRPPQQ